MAVAVAIITAEVGMGARSHHHQSTLTMAMEEIGTAEVQMATVKAVKEVGRTLIRSHRLQSTRTMAMEEIGTRKVTRATTKAQEAVGRTLIRSHPHQSILTMATMDQVGIMVVKMAMRKEALEEVGEKPRSHHRQLGRQTDQPGSPHLLKQMRVEVKLSNNLHPYQELGQATTTRTRPLAVMAAGTPLETPAIPGEMILQRIRLLRTTAAGIME